MALGAGLASQVGIVTEVTSGLQIPVTHFVEFNSETMEMDKNTVQGTGLRAPATGSGGGPAAGSSLFERSSRRVVGSWAAKGGVNLDIPFSGLGLFLEHMMGAFTPGVTGGTNNPLVVQQAATIAYLQTYAPGSLAGKTFCMQTGKPDSGGTVRPYNYVGCKCTDWQVDFALNTFAKLQLNIDAWQELTPDNPQNTTAGQALSAASYTAGQQFFHFRQALLYNAGTLATAAGVTSLTSPTAAARVLKGNIKVTNPLDIARQFVAGTGGSGVAGVKGEQLENNYRTIKGQLDVEFFNLAAYYDVAAAAPETTFPLWLEFVGPIIASTYAYTFAILIPNVRIDSPFTPKVPGPGILQHTLPITGLDDEVNNQIQIQYMSTDTVP
jgi:Phage tail tube protein